MTSFLDFNVEESPICFPQKRREQLAVQEQIALRFKLAKETVLIGCRNLKGSAESTKPCGPGRPALRGYSTGLSLSIGTTYCYE